MDFMVDLCLTHGCSNGRLQGLSNIAEQIVNATDDVIAFGYNTIPLKENLVEELENKICIADGTGGVADKFDAGANTVVQVLTSLQDFSKNELTELRDTFEVEFSSISEDFASASDSGRKWAQPYMVAVPVFMFGFILAVGSYLAWKGPHISLYFAIQKWAILPIFALVVVLMAFVLAITGTALVINSDVCLGKIFSHFVQPHAPRNYIS